MKLKPFSKLFFVALFFVQGVVLQAQINYHELGKKTLYYGISLGVNAGDMNVKRRIIMSSNDSVSFVDSKLGPGFNLGIIGNWQFHKYFDLRLIPSLVFTERNITYTHTTGFIETKNISSIFVSTPLLLRFKSEPINDFRICVLGGLRYDFDMASNKDNTFKPTAIKSNRHDLSLEYGVGFQIYFPYFILAPEFKMSHGFFNFNADPKYQSEQNINLLDQLFQRTFTLTINFEG